MKAAALITTILALGLTACGPEKQNSRELATKKASSTTKNEAPRSTNNQTSNQTSSSQTNNAPRLEQPFCTPYTEIEDRMIPRDKTIANNTLSFDLHLCGAPEEGPAPSNLSTASSITYKFFNEQAAQVGEVQESQFPAIKKALLSGYSPLKVPVPAGLADGAHVILLCDAAAPQCSLENQAGWVGYFMGVVVANGNISKTTDASVLYVKVD